MVKTAAVDGVDNPDVALRRLIDSLADRFPDVNRSGIEQRARHLRRA